VFGFGLLTHFRIRFNGGFSAMFVPKQVFLGVIEPVAEQIVVVAAYEDAILFVAQIDEKIEQLRDSLQPST
jgi:hypothetical protein